MYLRRGVVKNFSGILPDLKTSLRDALSGALLVLLVDK
jgi:hypothetical protein